MTGRKRPWQRADLSKEISHFGMLRTQETNEPREIMAPKLSEWYAGEGRSD
jgi:hypothetical protein